MTWGEKLHSAIERRDPTTLRRMAEETPKEETRIFLRLVANLIHQQPKRVTTLKRTA
jgi:hypothetical protein